MSARHTPGTWTAVLSRNGDGCVGLVSDGKHVIAQFYPDIRSADERADAECMENALRAAAAPDLLEVAETIELGLKRGYTPAELLDENSPIRDRIRAAIAKATGSGA